MRKKNIIITGASDGIGAAAARQLANNENYKLYLVGRNRAKTAAVADAVHAPYFIADFADLEQVRHLAEVLKNTLGTASIDMLVNNAGGLFDDFALTTDGFERTFQINYLAQFLLTSLLLPQFNTDQTVVINTSSVAHKLFGHLDLEDLNNQGNYNASKAYGDSKLADLLFTKELHRRYHNQGLKTVAFHPGVIRTNFSNGQKNWRQVYQSALGKLVLPSADAGGKTLRYFIEGTPDITWQSGQYYSKRRLSKKVNPQANDVVLQRQLWDKTLTLLDL
ncbi:MAG: SDR family NAD(P)-dependent oxidoreductase [Weissella hellenica]|uniref:SDR family NAD(P)-dependent oxidoreductase n=1 Tax=Weissella hellenica TaxID=46256 RepID=UPI003F96F4D0